MTARSAARPRPGRTRRRLRVAVGVLVAALVVTWGLVGLHPRLVPGGSSWQDPRVVTRPGTGADDEPVWEAPADDEPVTAGRTFRNAGPTNVTVRVPPPPPGPSGSVVLVDLLPGDPVTSAAGSLEGPGSQVLVVRPGETFAVRVGVGLGCARHLQGGGTGTDGVDLRVRTLGVSRTVRLPLGGTLLAVSTTDHEPSADCDR